MPEWQADSEAALRLDPPPEGELSGLHLAEALCPDLPLVESDIQGPPVRCPEGGREALEGYFLFPQWVWVSPQRDDVIVRPAGYGHVHAGVVPRRHADNRLDFRHSHVCTDLLKALRVNPVRRWG